MASGPARGGEECCSLRVSTTYITRLTQIGLDGKTAAAEEMTEAAEVTEELDEEEQIQNEVCDERLRLDVTYVSSFA